MRYIVIDTNIWVRIISQGRPSCEINYLDELFKLIDGCKVVLLLPEIIKLEIYKNWRSFADTVNVKIGVLEKDLEKPLKDSIWSEIDDVQKALLACLEDQRKQKLEESAKRFAQIETLLLSEKTVHLPFTQEIDFRGRKRLIAGEMPSGCPSYC